MSDDIKKATKTMLARLEEIGKPLTFATIETAVKNADNEKPALKKDQFAQIVELNGGRPPRLVRLMICNVEGGIGWWVRGVSADMDEKKVVVQFDDNFSEEEHIPGDSNLGRKIEARERFTLDFNQIWHVQ